MGRKPTIPQPKRCPVCGATWVPLRRDAQTCSDTCRQRWSRARRRHPAYTTKEN